MTAREGTTTAIGPREQRVSGFLEAIDELDPSLHAFITVTRHAVLRAARASDRRGGASDRPLEGMVVAIKDCIDVEGSPTTHGSPIFARNLAMRDAAVVARLRSAGALIVGKTNLHEFAMGATTRNTAFGTCRNPWSLDHIAGGSSGGSAAAAAAGLCDVAIGTDTGGSIRNPASFTGIVGLRPTFGTVPLKGVLRVSPTCDTAGPMARTVRDVERAFQVLAGKPAHGESPGGTRGDDIAGLRIGVLQGYFGRDVDPEILRATEEAVAELRRQGARIHDVTLAGAAAIERALGLGIMVAEAAALHRARLRRWPQRYDPGVRERLAIGARLSAADYFLASRVLGRWRGAVADAFARHDVLVGPATVSVAPRIAELAELTATSTRINHLNIPWSGAGTPVIVMPTGIHSSGLPMSLQVVAGWHAEAVLFRVARAWESSLGGFARPSISHAAERWDESPPRWPNIRP